MKIITKSVWQCPQFNLTNERKETCKASFSKKITLRNDKKETKANGCYLDTRPTFQNRLIGNHHHDNAILYYQGVIQVFSFVPESNSGPCSTARG